MSKVTGFDELTIGQLKALVINLGGVEKVNGINSGRLAVKLESMSIFEFLVDYDQPLSEAVEAGKYDWVNDDITPEHFPQTRQGKEEVAVELLHFNRVVSSKGALAEMKKQGCRPAVIEELLALGAAQPELQRQFLIVAFGSVWSDPDGHRCVPFLCGDVSRRGLGLRCLGGGWGGSDRFAVVREVAS